MILTGMLQSLVGKVDDKLLMDMVREQARHMPLQQIYNEIANLTIEIDQRLIAKAILQVQAEMKEKHTRN